MASVLDGSGFDVLNVTMAHAVAVAALPPHHADPFDGLLVVQAQMENLTIATADAAFDDYDVKVLDARA
jgi:PIN domain nuclease of toxin-antitoxin system